MDLARASVVLLVMASACGASPSGPLPVPHVAATFATPPAPELAPRPPRVDSDPSTYSACAAPSVLKLHAADDTSDPAVPRCAAGDAWARVPDREQDATVRCESAGRPGVLEQALSAALPLDAATADHVKAVFRAGQAQGRRANAFGLVGDSMTVQTAFLGPFSRTHALPVLPSDVEIAVALPSPDGKPGNVIDFFRHGRTAAGGADPVDPFLAPRAAKVGVRASWPLRPRGATAQTPLDAMVDAVSPAYAVILYGANDAVFRTDSLPQLRADFAAQLGAIVDALEGRGIVPLLTTIPKHMRQRGIADCSGNATGPGNERYAAQATALSAAVAELACQRHLPLIDLRWALDPLLNHGIGRDGIHLSLYTASGGAALDSAALQCGTNVRNLVTLRELALVVDAVGAGVW